MRTILLLNIGLWITLLLVFTTMNLPGNTLFWSSLQNSGHGLAMSFAAFIGITTLSLKSPSSKLGIYIAVTGALLVLSVLIEAAQHIIGRGASREDLYMDTAGIIAGACLSALMLVKSRLLLKAVLLMLGTTLLLFVIRQPALYFTANRFTPELPLLANFDNFIAHAKIRKDGAEFTIADHEVVWPLSTNKSLLATYSPGRWPFIHLMEPGQDWSIYSRLTFDVFNNQNTEVKLYIKASYEKTQSGDNSFMTARRIIPSGHSSIDIPYEELVLEYMGRKPDFTTISGLTFYLSRPKKTISLYFDNLMLR